MSKPPLPLKGDEEVQLTAMASGVLGIPGFKLKWKSADNATAEEIPTENLYPNIIEPLCSSRGLIMSIDCKTTFNKAQIGTEPVRVACPSTCLSDPSIKVYGTPTCYALHSSRFHIHIDSVSDI